MAVTGSTSGYLKASIWYFLSRQLNTTFSGTKSPAPPEVFDSKGRVFADISQQYQYYGFEWCITVNTA
jgi:hypothetical protein